MRVPRKKPCCSKSWKSTTELNQHAGEFKSRRFFYPVYKPFGYDPTQNPLLTFCKPRVKNGDFTVFSVVSPSSKYQTKHNRIHVLLVLFLFVLDPSTRRLENSQKVTWRLLFPSKASVITEHLAIKANNYLSMTHDH